MGGREGREMKFDYFTRLCEIIAVEKCEI